MRTSQSSRRIIRRGPFILILPFMIVFALIVSACGTYSTTGAGSQQNPTPAPTTIKGYGTDHGCPSDAVVGHQPPANIIIQLAQHNTTITAHKGDILEVRLPFGQSWHGPTTSQGPLQLQSPAGYAIPTKQICAWRFVAQTTGTAQLIYSGRPICKPGAMCPMFIISVPFTIDVK